MNVEMENNPYERESDDVFEATEQLCYVGVGAFCMHISIALVLMHATTRDAQAC